MSLPTEVEDDEVLVRAVRSPHAMNKSRTSATKKAFYPPNGSDEISVFRLAMGADECLERAKEITTTDQTSYGGVLTGSAGTVRNCELAVEDQRENYFVGHAGIVFAPISKELRDRKRGESLPPQARDELSRLTTFLLNEFRFLRSPMARNGKIVQA